MSDGQLLLWFAAIHVLGFMCLGVLLIPALRAENPESPPADQEGGGSSDDGWGNLPLGRPGSGGWPGGGIPLPDAEQSRVRLREPGRLGERITRPQRRPIRHPGPARRPVRTGR